MAGTYEEEIIGAKNRAETARRLREQAALSGTPQGQMFGNIYVAPHWTQHLANAIRQYKLRSDEEEALQESADWRRKQAQSEADIYGKLGIQAPPSLIQRASTPAQEPGIMDRIISGLRGEEAKGTPAQIYQPQVAQNLTPEQRQNALIQAYHTNPEIGKPLLDLEMMKQRAEERKAEKELDRSQRNAEFFSRTGVMPGEYGAVIGGRIIGPNGQVQTLPRVGSVGTTQGGGGAAAGAGMSANPWGRKVKSGDIVPGFDPQGNPVLMDKQTLKTIPVSDLGGFGKPKAVGSDLQDIPKDQLNAQTQNYAVIRNIDAALEIAKKNPEAFGMKNVVGQAIMQRVDPEGVDPRSAVGEIGATKIHDLSGAAVSVSEAPRFSPFVPSATDSPEKIVKNLERMKSNILALEEERRKTYGSSFKQQLRGPETIAPAQPEPQSGSSVDDLLKKYGGQ